MLPVPQELDPQDMVELSHALLLRCISLVFLRTKNAGQVGVEHRTEIIAGLGVPRQLRQVAGASNDDG
ncbi:hypothetical protein HMF7854_04220 [Sphingomonas ginkgonis]|uniref:Uncharacterized protein n=1 Tax=Sphingomonas ginkgonis TaxID=2315330 RepID=A0A3R9Y4Q3_9SPHN|nr:hypothetical protein HMF7854_04220 [Sphingomonas ginkgonis]